MNSKISCKISFLGNIVYFFLGGGIYYFLEIAFRGYSHYSMFIAGGLSLIAINILCCTFESFKKRNIFFKAIIGGFLITIIEFIVGIIYNVLLNQEIWDYTEMPLNLLGQICLPFSILWIALSFPAILVCTFCNGKFLPKLLSIAEERIRRKGISDKNDKKMDFE